MSSTSNNDIPTFFVPFVSENEGKDFFKKGNYHFEKWSPEGIREDGLFSHCVKDVYEVWHKKFPWMGWIIYDEGKGWEVFDETGLY